MHTKENPKTDVYCVPTLASQGGLLACNAACAGELVVTCRHMIEVSMLCRTHFASCLLNVKQ